MYVCSMSKVRVVSVDMDERDGVEWPEQQFQHRQSLVKKNKSEIKQEKKMSKTESRFKSKLESLKKFQHSASTNGAVEKARAFFRSLELKHIGGSGSSSSNNEHSSSSSSSSRRCTTTNNNNIQLPSSSSSSLKFPQPSSSSSSIIDDSHNTISTTTTNDSSLNSKTPSNCIATARIIRVINPKDMIIHRVIQNQQDDHKLASSSFNFQQTLPQNNIQAPKQYFNDRSQSYSVSFEKHREMQGQYSSRPLSPVSAVNPNITYSSHIYPPSTTHSTLTNGNISNPKMSASLYNYRPLVCRQMESSSLMSSSFHEQSNQSIDPIIRPLPSSASSTSMTTWTQSVRRLNTEYISTINALQQAKESLKQIYSDPTDTISKYANFVARGINNLSNNETKKSLGVTFCLTAPISQDSLSLSSSTSSSQISKTSIQQNKNSSSNVFSKPKLVRPLELDTFIPSIPPLPKLEPVPIIIEKNEQKDSIANIIKKFNNLNNSSSILKSPIIIDNNNNNSLSSQINKESQQDIFPKMFIYDSIQLKKDLSNISSLTSTTNINSNSSPRVHFEPKITTYELEEIPYESPPPPLTSSSSSSLASEDSTTSTTTSTSDGNQIYQNNYLNNYNQEETTYTVETFYKSTNDNNNNINKLSSSNNQQVVVIRENTTEEQFNLAKEKQHQDKNINQQKITINETNVPPLTTPLLTYLNLPVKQTTPTPPTVEKQETRHDNYHLVEPLSHIKNDFISNIYHDENDETLSDVVTINPYTHSPPSHRLINSSSSSSTTSSASTVLLSNNTNTTRPISSSVTKTLPITNGNLNKNNNKSISQLPKRTTIPSTITNASRLKQPTKIVSSSSKLKPPSSTVSKPIKSMIANSTSTAIATATTASSMRKPTGITNQSSTMTNNSVNKSTQQQSSSSTLTTGKKQQLVNGINMTESQNATDSSNSLGKNRVRSMVNQLNAAVSSSRPAVPSTISGKRIPTTNSTTINSRRLVSIEPTTSTNKISITSPSRPALQRAMTISNQSPVTPSPPSTPPIMNNNIPSTYKRKTPLIRSTSNVKEGLLRWCQVQVAGYPNVSVTNLSSSWSDGLAFCALTHHFFPDAFDFNSLSSTNRKYNFELAFRIAEERAGVPQLLDVSDMLIMGNTPDYKCIFTYLNSFLAKVKDIHPITNGVEHH